MNCRAASSLARECGSALSLVQPVDVSTGEPHGQFAAEGFPCFVSGRGRQRGLRRSAALDGPTASDCGPRTRSPTAPLLICSVAPKRLALTGLAPPWRLAERVGFEPTDLSISGFQVWVQGVRGCPLMTRFTRESADSRASNPLVFGSVATGCCYR